MHTGRCARCGDARVLKQKNLCGTCYVYCRKNGLVQHYGPMTKVPKDQHCLVTFGGQAGICTGRQFKDGLCEYHTKLGRRELMLPSYMKALE